MQLQSNPRRQISIRSSILDAPGKVKHGSAVHTLFFVQDFCNFTFQECEFSVILKRVLKKFPS